MPKCEDKEQGNLMSRAEMPFAPQRKREDKEQELSTKAGPYLRNMRKARDIRSLVRAEAQTTERLVTRGALPCSQQMRDKSPQCWLRGGER